MTATELLYCPRCDAIRDPDGGAADPEWAFCVQCGTRLSDSAEARIRHREYELAHAPQFVFAGFWRRALGWVIDRVTIIGIAIVASFGYYGTLAAAGSDLERSNVETVATLLDLVIGFTYYVVGNALGATLGKFVVGVRIVDQFGNRPGFKRAIIRYPVSLISALVIGLGYWRAAWDPERQTWHDTLAGTFVIRAPRS